MKLYEITEDLKAVEELFNSAVDENGEPRELTAEEQEFLNSCFQVSSEEFETKFDNFGRFMANLKAQAEEADGARKAIKSEVDRLSARAKAFENRRDIVKNYLFFNMQNLKIDKYKSSLFSAGIQTTPYKVTSCGSLKDIPEQFLKPREIDASAIKAAIKDGEIKEIDGVLFYDGEELQGVKATKGQTLVIR